MDKSLKTDIISVEDLIYQKLLSERFKTSYEPLYECYLGPQTKRTDVSLLFLNVINRQDPFVLNQDDVADDVPGQDAWRKIDTFFKQWRTGESKIWKYWINYVWMEFDNDETPPHKAIPSLFFNTSGGRNEDIEELPDKMRAKHSLDVTTEALRYLLHDQLSVGIENRLNKAFSDLPEGAHIGDVGIMYPRVPLQIKLIIRDIQLEDTLQYMNKLGLNDDFTESIIRFCKSCSCFYDKFKLSVDIGEESISTRVGIEFFINEGYRFKEKWELFFNYLVDSTLCTPDKRDAILQFVKTGGSYETINYVKVVFLPGKRFEAKAYLYNLSN